MPLLGSVRASINITNTLAGIDLSIPTENVAEAINVALSEGVIYHDEINLGISELYALDFGDNSLQDVFGNPIAMTDITAFYLEADGDNTVDVVVTDGTDSFFPTLPPLGAGEGFDWCGSIDAESDNRLYLQNGAAYGKVKLIVVGTEETSSSSDSSSSSSSNSSSSSSGGSSDSSSSSSSQLGFSSSSSDSSSDNS